MAKNNLFVIVNISGIFAMMRSDVNKGHGQRTRFTVNIGIVTAGRGSVD